MIKALALALAISGLASGYAVAQTAAPATEQAPAATPAPTETAPAATAPAAPAPATEATAATSPDDCLKAASELAVDAGEKKLAEDRLDQIEDLLIKMETHCDAKQFPEAQAVAKDIKSLIETR